MAKEIERKFLVDTEKFFRFIKETDEGITAGLRVEFYRQGYISTDPKKTIRVRLVSTAVEEKAYLTIKGEKIGITNSEYEFEVPKDKAKILLDEVGEAELKKFRYLIPVVCVSEGVKHKHIWEVDEYIGENKGLVVAEIELESEDEVFDKPDWIGEEVTHDKRYASSNLSLTPFKTWQRQTLVKRL